jgi:hypothetical protein
LKLIVTAFSVRGHVLRDAAKSVWSGPGKIDPWKTTRAILMLESGVNAADTSIDTKS